MNNDIQIILHWWVLWFGLGVVSLPLALLTFGRFFDFGYPFSRVLGILAISYFVWVLGSLRLLPFSSQTLVLIIAALVFVNVHVLRRNLQLIKVVIKKSWKIFLFEELLFLTTLAAWSIVRGFQPDIRGLEKFMDFGFVNSILRSDYFPPADMWFAGKSVNYYYFGHLVSAVLTKLSGIPSHITYNLLIATIFALAFTCAFSLGSTLVHTLSGKRVRYAIVGGLLTSIILTLGGNLHPLYWFLTHGNFASYWYPDATRFIVQQFGAADNTIHEFPIYSFVVADLHGHLINLPFVLMFLAVILTMFMQKRVSLFLCFFVSWLLAIFYITNAWDLPIYGLVFGAAVLYFNWMKYKSVFLAITRSVLVGIGVTLGALLFSLPFHLNFENISKGVAFVDFHSPLWTLAVLWGLPLATTLIFFVFLFLQKKRFRQKLLGTDIFISILISISWFLVLLPEIIYVKDIYIHSHQRANTMFKFTYQAFVMFSIASAYVLARIATSPHLKTKRSIQSVLLLPIVFCLLPVLIYQLFAVRSYYGLKNYQGLSGESWLAREYPDEYQSIRWLRENTKGKPVILEATGDSYTDYNLVSSYTGLPTVEGWTVHEWLWRGSFDEPGKRAAQVETIYTTEDVDKTSEMLDEYNIEYVVVGSLERQKYPNLQEGKFIRLGKIVFSSSGTNIYKVN